MLTTNENKDERTREKERIESLNARNWEKKRTVWLPKKFKYFALGNDERNDYKKETITLPMAKRTKRARRSKRY